MIIPFLFTNARHVPARSKPFIISGKDAVSPPIIEIFESSVPFSSPLPIYFVIYGLGSSIAK